MKSGRLTYDYGIDLGTTNSAIAVMEDGVPKILKNEQGESVTPSCIHFDQRRTDRLFVGRRAKMAHKQFLSNALKGKGEAHETFLEFKRNMGLSLTYETSKGRLAPEDLSAEVLRFLTSLEVDEVVDACVVTVPAMFQMNQKDATVVAARRANIAECRLLQEPIAAAMAYGIGVGDLAETDARWIVFDFGVGTFDVALIGVSDGILSVIDTAGDNHLGGQDLDRAIVDRVLLPHLRQKYSVRSIEGNDSRLGLLKGLLKFYAEDARVAISFNDSYEILSDFDEFPNDDNGEEMLLDLTVTRGQLEPHLIPIYERAIRMTDNLLERRGLTPESIDQLLLVGGPTQSPLLRDMLRAKFGERVNTGVDPMTAVAVGAALYASTLERERKVSEELPEDTIRMSLAYEKQTVESSEIVRVKIGGDGDAAATYSVEFKRHDGGFSTGKVTVKPNGSLAELLLLANKSNVFDVRLTDSSGVSVACEPSKISISHGLKVAQSTLAFGIGIGVENHRKGYAVVKSIEGLEKGARQPAKGRIKGLKTQRDIRPGNGEDILKIPVYEFRDGASNSRLIHNNHVFDAIITGEKFEELLPRGSEIELVLQVTDSKIDLSVYFPTLDLTEEITNESVRSDVVSEAYVSKQMSELESRVTQLEEDGAGEHFHDTEGMRRELEELQVQFRDGRSDGNVRQKMLDQMRGLAIDVDAAEESVEWPKLEKELLYEYELVKELVASVSDAPELNHEKVQKEFSSLERRLEEVKKSEDVSLADDLHSDFIKLRFSILDVVMGAQLEMSWIRGFNEDFDSYSWIDRSRARALVDRAVQLAEADASKDELRPIVSQIVSLLPDRERPGVSDTQLPGMF